MISPPNDFRDIRFSQNHNGTPVFESPNDWYNAFRQAVNNGWPPWPPVSLQEFLLADSMGLVRQNPQWIPCRDGLRLLGLPDTFGRIQEPWGEKTKERLLSTLLFDPEFASALRTIIRMEGR